MFYEKRFLLVACLLSLIACGGWGGGTPQDNESGVPPEPEEQVPENSAPEIIISQTTYVLDDNKQVSFPITVQDDGTFVVSVEAPDVLFDATVTNSGGSTYTVHVTYNGSAFGSQEVTIQVSDGQKVDTQVITIINEDPNGPQLFIDGQAVTASSVIETTLSKNTPYTPLQVSAEDEKDGVLTVIFNGQDLLNTEVAGVYIIEYSATDSDEKTSAITHKVTVENINATLLNTEFSLQEDQQQTFTLMPEAADGDTLSLALDTANLPQGMLFEQNPNNPFEITVQWPENTSGDFVVPYEITNDEGEVEDSGSLTVSISNVPDDNPLTASIYGSETCVKGTSETYTIVHNDPDGSSEVSSATLMQSGSVVQSLPINNVGANTSSVTLNCDAEKGIYEIHAVVSGAIGGENNVSDTTLEKTITVPNSLPTVQDITATVTAGESITIAVLEHANDLDANDTLNIVLANVDTGTVTITPEDTLLYTAPIGFEGVATITHDVSDGEGVTEGKVFVEVEAAPVLNVVFSASDENLREDSYGLGVDHTISDLATLLIDPTGSTGENFKIISNLRWVLYDGDVSPQTIDNFTEDTIEELTLKISNGNWTEDSQTTRFFID